MCSARVEMGRELHERRPAYSYKQTRTRTNETETETLLSTMDNQPGSSSPPTTT